jgi:integrase
MASLRFHRNGWELRYLQRDGRGRCERFAGGTPRRPPEAAVERKAEVEAQLRRGTYVAREDRDAPFRAYYERWWAARQISETRRYTDLQRGAKHVLPYWGNWPINTIRPSDIDDWVAGLSSTLGPQSVRDCYAMVRGPLRRAARDRIIADPCIDIRLPKLKDISKTFDEVLTADEVDRLTAAMLEITDKYSSLRTNHRYQALVFMGAWLGPRWNEAIGLRICDLNPLRHEATFGRLVVNQNGSRTFTEIGSKTGDWRTVPVPEPVMDVLNAHIARYRPGAGRDELIFTNNRNGHILRGTFSRNALAPAVQRAGLDGRRVTWMTLRHTAASLMFDAGLTLFEVQQRLGHKSPTLTAKVYTHLMRERFEEGRGRLEQYMAAKRTDPFDAGPPAHPTPAVEDVASAVRALTN